MVIGFLVAFLAVFGAFFFLGRGGGSPFSGSWPIKHAGTMSSQCNGNTCSLR